MTTLILSKLVTWMRKQSGTTDLRALLYMDEVAGYLPPTAMPPTKKPIMTLMKQARAFGVGVVLSTQNPTIQVSFQSLATGYAPQQSIIMAGTLYGTIPVLVVFALLGRQIVGGIMQGAVKG